MSCPKHPQWIHGREDCPMCVPGWITEAAPAAARPPAKSHVRHLCGTCKQEFGSEVRAEQAEARLAKLFVYAQHKDGCDATLTKQLIVPCSCGLAEVRALIAAVKQEQP